MSKPDLGRKPDFILKLMNKVTGEKSRHSGAGWINSNGSINILIDPFVVIPNSHEVSIVLFPKNYRGEEE